MMTTPMSSEYNTVKIRKNAYETARKQAEKEGTSITETIGKAIDRYVETRRDLEERVRLLIKLYDQERERQL